MVLIQVNSTGDAKELTSDLTFFKLILQYKANETHSKLLNNYTIGYKCNESITNLMNLTKDFEINLSYLFYYLKLIKSERYKEHLFLLTKDDDPKSYF